MRKIRSSLIVLAAASLAACGGGGALEQSGVTVAGTTPESSVRDTAADTVPREFDIAEIEASVVKIAAEGSFVDPEVGEMRNSAGVGSGVIISEDGLVVTNHHVVTGAALLRVTVPGLDRPVNARILGVSECSDLAVIDLDGEGYTPLQFRDDPVRPGTEVYAAGYPASDASTIDEVDYTLTNGIISSVTANGETSWASVEEVIEHDARIRGGNSGGPLVDETGQIVGINYAGIDVSDQNYAIAVADARPIIDQLVAGDDVDTIGINGQAVYDSASGISGVWVANVESGSPADLAGLEPGDIVTRLEGLDLAMDGTLSDYCDIIRTKGSDATMAIEVLRFATEEVYEGQLNGMPLELSYSFAQELEDVAEDDPGATGGYAEYVYVSDDTGAISVELPAEWVDVDGAENPEFGPSLYASTDLTTFLESWDAPGVIIEVTNGRGASDIDATLDEMSFADGCTYEGRSPYSDPLYSGSVDTWTDCGGTGTVAIVVAVSPADGASLIRVFIQAVSERDLEAADHIFNTFVASI